MDAPEQMEALAHAWEGRDRTAWAAAPGRYSEFAQQALSLGAPSLAFDIADEGRAVFPGDQRLRYVAALALANGGASGRAARLLKGFEGEGADISALAGRLAKDRWARMLPGAARDAVAIESRDAYARAYAIARDVFPGINAATMSVLAGDEPEGRRLAREVRELALERIRAVGDAHWLHATVGEACLLLDEGELAREHYRAAAAGAGKRHGDVASMRRQVRLMSERRPNAQVALGDLRIPRVGVFTGHMVDRPGRALPRFPAGLESRVAEAIARAIDSQDLGFGYCSAACGADLVFAERMLERGAEVDIVLPFARGDFVHTSVAFAGEDWVRRFDRVLSRASSVRYGVSENHLGDDVLYAYAADLTAGLALLRAAQLETEAVLVALAEPGDAGGVGGTAANIGRWRSLGRAAAIIDLRALRDVSGPVRNVAVAAVESTEPAVAKGVPWRQRQVRTMLFADMAGYSRLKEHETPGFFVQFLGALERALHATPAPPAFGNTWGDGLYLVFDEPAQGADFALHLRDEISRVEWAAAGLPADMAIRIAMHTGPVFRALDPVIQRENFFGSHVTRAARLEPVASPGSIYVTEQTAAALAARGSNEYACDYLGEIQLAKAYGRERAYRLRRGSETE